MATRSSIAIQNDDGSVTGIYCHNDGYPSHNGKILVEHYNTPERVRALVALGDISVLAPNLEGGFGHSFDNPVKGAVIAYIRDRGEEGCTTTRASNYADFLRGMRQEYNYLFRDGKWFVRGSKGKAEAELE